MHCKLNSQILCLNLKLFETVAHVLGETCLETLHMAERLADLTLQISELYLQIAALLVKSVKEVVVVRRNQELLFQGHDAFTEFDKLRLHDSQHEPKLGVHNFRVKLLPELLRQEPHVRAQLVGGLGLVLDLCAQTLKVCPTRSRVTPLCRLG